VSAIEVGTRTNVILHITCEGCDATTTVDVDELYLESELLDALPEGWTQFRDHLYEPAHLCPNCKRCDEIGHCWYPAVVPEFGANGLHVEVLRCKVCAYQCHAGIPAEALDV
jgi:hypothetical protein